MNYHVQYRRDPSLEDAATLAEYVASDDTRGGVVVDRSGVRMDGESLSGWTQWAARQDMVRLHSAAFAREHSVDDLADAAREVARDQLEGEWFVGVHCSNPGNPHVHLAQAGTEQQLWMTGDDIKSFRSELASTMGEPYGESDAG